MTLSALRDEMKPESLARRFHEAYERLAPTVGYQKRSDTRKFDPLSLNGRLMIAVCGEIAPLFAALIDVAEAAQEVSECVAAHSLTCPLGEHLGPAQKDLCLALASVRAAREGSPKGTADGMES